MSHYRNVSKARRRLVRAARQCGLLPEVRHRLVDPRGLQSVPRGTAFVLRYNELEVRSKEELGSWYDSFCKVFYGREGLPLELPAELRPLACADRKRRLQVTPWLGEREWVGGRYKEGPAWKPRPLSDLGLPSDHAVPDGLPVVPGLRHLCVVRGPGTEDLLDWPLNACFALWRDDAWCDLYPGASKEWLTYVFFAANGLPWRLGEAQLPGAADERNEVLAYFQLCPLRSEKRYAELLGPDVSLLGVARDGARFSLMAGLMRGLSAYLPVPTVAA